MRVDRDVIGQLAEGYQRLTIEPLQDTEKVVLYRGKFLRESEMQARFAEADAEEPRAVAKGWYKSEMADIQMKQYKVPKGVMQYTCEECDGYWLKTGSATTTVGSTEIDSPSGSTEMVDAEAGTAPPAPRPRPSEGNRSCPAPA